MRKPCPCKGCEKRHFLCHGNCHEYKEFKDRIAEINLAREKERAKSNSPERNREIFRKAMKQR